MLFLKGFERLNAGGIVRLISCGKLWARATRISKNPPVVPPVFLLGPGDIPAGVTRHFNLLNLLIEAGRRRGWQK